MGRGEKVLEKRSHRLPKESVEPGQYFQLRMLRHMDWIARTGLAHCAEGRWQLF